MGGSIGFGVRTSDYKEYFIDRWTNDLFWRIASPDFINEGEELKLLIDEAKPENKWPEARLLKSIKKCEYGLVLVDFPNRKVYSRNDYSAAGQFYISPFSSAISEEMDNAIKLAKQGLLGEIELYSYQKENHIRKNISVDEFLENYKQIDRNFNGYLICNLNNKTFEFDHKCERKTPVKEINRWVKNLNWKTKVAYAKD